MTSATAPTDTATFDVGNDAAAVAQEAIEPMRTPALVAGAVGATVALVLVAVALARWVKGRQGA
jgi:hypothetical protein